MPHMDLVETPSGVFVRHLDDLGCCECLCPTCTTGTGEQLACSCPDCDAKACGLHRTNGARA